MRHSYWFLTGAAFVLIALPGCEMKSASKKTKTDPPGKKKKVPFTPLKFADFDVYTGKLRRGEVKPEGPTWSEKDGVISCSGLPRGYIYTKKSYRNCEIRFEYRFEKFKNAEDIAKLNSGCLLFIEGEHRTWPVCLEVQGKHLEMGMIKSNARDITVKTDDEREVRREHRMNPGSWNRVVIRCDEGKVLVTLNGAAVASSHATRLKEGPFGFQAEGWPVQFRNIGVRPFKATVDEGAKTSKTE